MILNKSIGEEKEIFIKNIIILGGGRVGSVASCLLVESGNYRVYLIYIYIPDDKPVLEKNIDNLKYVELDAANSIELQNYVKQNDVKMIVSCLPFFLNKILLN